MADGGFNKLERKILKRKCQKGREHSWNKKQAKINSEEMNVTPFQATLDTPPPQTIVAGARSDSLPQETGATVTTQVLWVHHRSPQRFG